MINFKNYFLSLNRKKIIIFGLLLFLILIIAFGVYRLTRPAFHYCGVDKFTETLSTGKSAEFVASLDPSRVWRKYRVKMGNLPRGVTADVYDYEGRGEGRAKIKLNVGDDPKKGNYSLMIVYEEEEGNGQYTPSYCQFNLIVE